MQTTQPHEHLYIDDKKLIEAYISIRNIVYIIFKFYDIRINKYYILNVEKNIRNLKNSKEINFFLFSLKFMLDKLLDKIYIKFQIKKHPETQYIIDCFYMIDSYYMAKEIISYLKNRINDCNKLMEKIPILESKIAIYNENNSDCNTYFNKDNNYQNKLDNHDKNNEENNEEENKEEAHNKEENKEEKNNEEEKKNEEEKNNEENNNEENNEEDNNEEENNNKENNNEENNEEENNEEENNITYDEYICRLIDEYRDELDNIIKWSGNLYDEINYKITYDDDDDDYD